MAEGKKNKSSSLLEGELLKIIKDKNLKSGDYFMSESEIKEKLEVSRSAIYQVLLVLKVKGVIYQDELKNNRISPMYNLYLEQQDVQQRRIKQSICLPTGTAVPQAIVKKYDFYDEYATKSHYMGFVILNFRTKDDIVPSSYEINWVNNRVYDMLTSSDITKDNFLKRLYERENLTRINSIQEVHLEPKTKSDINIFKEDAEGEKFIPTIYTVDYDTHGNVINIKIKKTSPKKFKHYNFKSKVQTLK